MADSILKLKVDDKEYTASLKDAKKGIIALEQSLRDSGATFTQVDRATVNYTRAIGQMATVSTTAKGKVSEMTSAFTELSVQYKQLTDEEKQSPFGQALSASLDQLRERVLESKSQLDDVNQSLQTTASSSDETGGIMSSLARKFNITLDAVKLFNIGLEAAGKVLGVAKDAFFQNEEQLDEWGRTVEASESLYRGFLNALNNGDISGFLSKISSIVQAARDAYDALDELATYNAFNQINVEKTRFNLSESINDFREGKGSKDNVKSAGDAVIKELRTRQQKETEAYKAAVGKVAAERGVSQRDLLDALSGTYGHYSDLKSTKMTGSRTVMYGGGMFGGGGSYQVATPRTRQEQLGQALRKINDTELQQLQALGAQAQRTGIEIEGVNRQIIRTMNARTGGGGGRSGGGSGGGRSGGGRRGTVNTPPPAGSIAEQEAKVQALTKAWREASDQAGRDGYLSQLNEAKTLLDEMQGKVKEVVPEGSLKALGEEMRNLQAQRELLTDPTDIAILDAQIEQVKDSINELNGVRPSGPSEPSSLIDQVRADVSDQNIATDTTTLTNLLEFQIKNGIEGLDIPVEYLQEAIFGEGMDIPDEYWTDLADKINEKLAELGIDPITIDVETGGITQTAKQTKEGWKDAAKAVQSVGSALQQLEDPSAKIAGIVGEAIASIALGFAQATASDSKLGVFGWIAAIAGGLGTMISTIAAIKSATAGSYAEGGIIPGSSYSGDNLLASVNSGEVILNRAQQSNLAGQLASNQGDSKSRPYLDVETIWLGMGHYLKRKGMGEIVTTR